MGDVLALARDFHRRRVWTDAYRCLASADQTQPLDREDLELFGTSAYMLGLDAEYQSILERCHRAHVAAGHNMRAARIGFWLALNSLLHGQAGAATGWLARGRRLIESHDCVEHGYLLLPLVEQDLAERKSDDARAVATSACEIGVRFNDADLIACAPTCRAAR